MPDPLSSFENHDLRRIVFSAQIEAARSGATEVAPEHLLPALLLFRRTGLARRLLAHVSIQDLRGVMSPGAAVVDPTRKPDLPRAAATERALAVAVEEAERDGQTYIGAEYLLLALLREPRVAEILGPHRITLDSVRAAIDASRNTTPVLRVVDSPAPDVSLVPYNSAAHPEFTGMLGELPTLRGTSGHAVVFTNLSAEPITAIVARWTILDPAGTSRTRDVTRDDYSYLRHNRVQGGMPDDSIAPGARMLVTVGGFHPPIDMRGCYVFASSGSDRIEDDASEITVALDSVVYPDGRLVGPDEYGIGNHLHGRYAAAQEIVARIDQAIAAHEDVDAVLGAIAEGARGPAMRWHRMFASSGMTRGPDRVPGYTGWLESARNMPRPPQLFRSRNPDA